jgi:large exoprotein involved in heme utilization and adhesion
LNNSSLISSSVSDGSGGGGNIILRASEMFMAFNDSDILANAKVGDGGNITIDSPVFIADLFANVGRNPGKDFSRFRGNGRVDISATSVFGGTGTVNIPDTSFIQYSLSTMEGEFVPAEQIVAGTCLARRNSQQSSFVVTGTGGLARTPYAQVAGRYDVVQVQPLGNEAPGVNNRNLSREPAPESPLLSWKSGDPVQEAQGFIRTPDGRVVIGTAPQLASVILAQDLVCNFRSQNP